MKKFLSKYKLPLLILIGSIIIIAVYWISFYTSKVSSGSYLWIITVLYCFAVIGVIISIVLFILIKKNKLQKKNKVKVIKEKQYKYFK